MAPVSTNACCKGSSPLLSRQPCCGCSPSASIVTSSCPSAWTASMTQLFTGSPSKSTVQAPHSPVSHPCLTPKIPSSSRNVVSKVVSGGTSISIEVPLRVKRIIIYPSPPSRVALRGHQQSQRGKPHWRRHHQHRSMLFPQVQRPP